MSDANSRSVRISEVPSVSDVDRRLRRLELHNRRLRGAVATLAAGLLAVPTLAFLPPARGAAAAGQDEVRTRVLVLVDAADQERGRLAADADGNPMLVLRDRTGIKRAQLGVSDQETLLILRDREEKTRIGMAIDGGRHPHFVMSDTDEKPRLHMALNLEGAPSLLCIHRDGTMPAGLGVHASGEPWLRPEPPAPGAKTKK